MKTCRIAGKVQILWTVLRVEHPETARRALLTMTSRDFDGLSAGRVAVRARPVAPAGPGAAQAGRGQWPEDG